MPSGSPFEFISRLHYSFRLSLFSIERGSSKSKSKRLITFQVSRFTNLRLRERLRDLTSDFEESYCSSSQGLTSSVIVSSGRKTSGHLSNVSQYRLIILTISTYLLKSTGFTK